MKQQNKPARRTSRMTGHAPEEVRSHPAESASESNSPLPIFDNNASPQTEAFRLLFDHHPLPMWICDLKTLAFLAVNEAAQEKYGYARDEFLEMTLKDIHPREEIPRLQKVMRHKRPAGQHSGLWSHRLKDGTVFDVEISSHIIEYEGRQTALVVAEDVTERKRVEEALRLSEEKYRALVENINDVHYSLDTQGCFTYISPVIERFAHYQVNEVVGEPFTRFVHPEDLSSLGASFKKTLTGKQEPFEFRIFARDGAVLHVRTSSRPLWEGNQLVGLTGVMMNLTDRKRAEEALHESEARYHRLFKQTQATLAETQALYRVSRSVIALKSLAEMLQTAVDAVADALPANRVTLITFDLEAQQVTHFVRGGPGADQVKRVLYDELWNGLSGWVLRESRPALSSKSGPDPRESLEVQRRRAETNCGDIIVVPLRYQDKTLGTITAINLPDEREFTEHDVELMMAMASQAAMAIENARLYEELQLARAELERRVEERTADLSQANRMLNMLSECNQALVRTTEEPTLLQKICHIIVNQGGYPMAWVGLAEQDAVQTVRPVAQAGFEEGYLSTVNINWADNERGQGPTGTAIRSGQPCVARNIQTDPNFAPWRVEAIRRGYASSIALPLRDDDRVFGALIIYSDVPDAFQAKEINLLMELASDLAFGITSLQERAARKWAEEQLRRLADLQSAILNNAAYMVISTDGEGFITTFNPAAERALGYTAEECVGKLTPVIFHELDEVTERARIFSAELDATIKPDFEVFAAKARRNLPNEYEWTYIRKDGSHFPVLLSITALFDSQGDIVGFLGIANDITEKKRTQEALQESEERWRRLVEYLPAGVVVHSGGKIVYANKNCLQMAGATREEEVVGKPLMDFVHPDYRETVIQRVKGMLELGQFGPPLEEVFLKLDGSSWYVEVTAHPLTYLGKPAVQTVFWDITERKRAEAAVQASEERYRVLYEDNPSMYFTVDTEGKVLSVNRFGAEQLGYTAEELVGQFILNVFYPDDRPNMLKQLAACLQNPKQLAHWELRNVRKNGSLLWVKETARAVHQPEGKLVVLIVCEDITERRQAERVREALYEISQAVISADKLEDFYHLIHNILGGLITAENFFIALYDPSSDLLSYPYFVDQFDAVPAPEKPGRGLTGYVLRTGHALLASPEAFETLIEQGEVELDGSPSIDWMGVPLRVENHIIGVMAVQSYTERVRYGKKEMDIMEFVSTQVAMAIERKRSFEEIRQHIQQLNALRTIDVALTSSFDLQLNLSVLLEQVITQLAVDAADVLLLNPYTLMLEYATGRGFRTRTMEGARIRLGESFAGIAALERRAVQLDNLAQIQENPQFAAFWAGEGVAAYHAVPLIAKGQVKGVLEVFHRTPLAAERGWVSFLEALAGQAAIAIENAQLFDHLQRSNVDLVLAYDATIEGWARALDLRDKETEGHTRRVAELTERLARVMGMSEVDIVHARRGAFLHDIGKMAVQDSILLKPDKLTTEEWMLMRQHPQYAFDMLAPIAFLRPALDIPYCHHEKWDGTGYPRGLKGEQIPLAARLFAVIDVYDALISDRLYRAAWSREKTLEYIETLAGTHFDPMAVELFMKKI